MKTLVKTLSLSIVAALISGCSSVTDVVPDEKVLNVNGNTYEILDVDYRGIFGSENSLKSSVITQADKFAKSQGMVASPLSARIHRVGILGDWAWFYYKFNLVSPGTPDSYRNFTDIKIIRDARLAPEFYSERNQINEGEEKKDIYSEIKKLDSLRKEGLITNEEFESKKQQILSSK
nr:SHOCT domain-containing protein [uncultured Tolumonas sp.]